MIMVEDCGRRMEMADCMVLSLSSAYVHISVPTLRVFLPDTINIRLKYNLLDLLRAHISTSSQTILPSKLFLSPDKVHAKRTPYEAKPPIQSRVQARLLIISARNPSCTQVCAIFHLRISLHQLTSGVGPILQIWQTFQARPLSLCPIMLGPGDTVCARERQWLALFSVSAVHWCF